MKPTSLNDNIIYLCGEFSHQFGRLLNMAFHQNGLAITPEQLSILALLWYTGPITQQAISISLMRDKTTITRVVQNMKKKKLVDYASHPEDNRAKLVLLTPQGKEMQGAALKVSGALYLKTLEGIGYSQLQVTIEVMHKLLNNHRLLAEAIINPQ